MTLALIGATIILISILGSWLFVRRHNTEQERQVKAVLFGLYFWGLVFLQLIIAAAGYYWFKYPN